MPRPRQNRPANRRRDGREGWVYVFSNPSLRGVHKIGRTSNELTVRAAELHATGVPTPFRIELAIWVRDCVKLEKWIHRHLARDRVHQGREFFKTSLHDIVAGLEQGVTENELVCHKDHDPNGLLSETRVRWARESIARAEAKREEERCVRIKRELQEAIAEAKRPLNALRPRAALVAGVVLVVAAMAAIIWAYQAGAGGWTIALGIGLTWLLSQVTNLATELLLATFWAPVKFRQRERIEQLHQAARESIASGTHRLGIHIKSEERRSVLRCTGCGVGMSVPAGMSGLINCPRCGKRDHYDARS